MVEIKKSQLAKIQIGSECLVLDVLGTAFEFSTENNIHNIHFVFDPQWGFYSEET